MALPFSKTQMTTGPWVSENWLAWVRISKICYAYSVQRGIEDERKGANDILRMVTSFSALTSRLVSHDPFTEETKEITDAMLKEFLSSVRELDLRARAFKKSATPKGKKSAKSKKAEGSAAEGNQGKGKNNESAKAKKAKGSAAKSKKAKGSAAEGNQGKAKNNVAREKQSVHKKTQKTKHSLKIDGGQGPVLTKTDRGTGEKEAKDEKNGLWWLKSNYVSLLNVLPIMTWLGPLINFWDGGGKGEKYIQEIKPHIPRGIRMGQEYFCKLTQRVYKKDCCERISKMAAALSKMAMALLLGLSGMGEDDGTISVGDSEEETVDSDFGDLPVEAGDFASEDGDASEDRENDSDTDTGDDDSVEGEDCQEGTKSGVVTDAIVDNKEDHGYLMSKARTFYIYKNKNVMEAAVAANDPIAGVVIGNDMYVVYRSGRNELGWNKLDFEDVQGVKVFNMWYSTLMVMEETENPPGTVVDLSKVIDMATVAIPLRFGVPPVRVKSAGAATARVKPALAATAPPERDYWAEHGHKYAVISNWWKERDENGRYTYPTLSSEHYQERSKTPMP